MKPARDHVSIDRRSASVDLVRGLLLFTWCVVRIPLLVVLSFVEPLVRFVLISIAILGLVSGLAYVGSSVEPAIPFWVVACVSLGCLMLVVVYHAVIRLLSK